MIKDSRITVFRRKIGKKLIGLALILMGIAIILSIIVRPNIIKVCEYNTKNVTVRLIDDAISEQLDTLGTQTIYSQLINLSYDEYGRVSSIESNTALINRIKTDILNMINDRLKDSNTEAVDMSLGTLSGIAAFYGQGPDISMTIEPKGYADAVFISEFSDSGINQTRHRIIMRTSVNVTSFIPLYSVECTVSGDFLIAETIIVGDVPESYTHVISSNEDVVDKIYDFVLE